MVGILSSAKWGTGSDKGTVTVAAAMPSAGEEISKQVHQVIDTLPFGNTLFRNEQLITPPGELYLGTINIAGKLLMIIYLDELKLH